MRRGLELGGFGVELRLGALELVLAQVFFFSCVCACVCAASQTACHICGTGAFRVGLFGVRIYVCVGVGVGVGVCSID